MWVLVFALIIGTIILSLILMTLKAPSYGYLSFLAPHFLAIQGVLNSESFKEAIHDNNKGRLKELLQNGNWLSTSDKTGIQYLQKIGGY